MKKIFSILIIFVLIAAALATTPCRAQESRRLPHRIFEIACDSIYPGKDYKMVQQWFPEGVRDTLDGDNTVAEFLSGSKVIYRDTLYSFSGIHEFRDFNGDGIRDILISGGISARSNSFYHLFLVDTLNDRIVKIRGFEELPNPDYMAEYDLVRVWGLAGINWTGYRAIEGDSIRDFGIAISDHESDDSEVFTPDSVYENAIRRIQSIRKAGTDEISLNDSLTVRLRPVLPEEYDARERRFPDSTDIRKGKRLTKDLDGDRIADTVRCDYSGSIVCCLSSHDFAPIKSISGQAHDDWYCSVSATSDGFCFADNAMRGGNEYYFRYEPESKRIRLVERHSYSYGNVVNDGSGGETHDLLTGKYDALWSCWDEEYDELVEVTMETEARCDPVYLEDFDTELDFDPYNAIRELWEKRERDVMYRYRLEKAILTTIRAWHDRDEERLNSLVSPDFGLTFIYRPGAAQTMTTAEGISFDKPMPNYLAYLTDITVEDEVHFEELPEFDCYEWEWSKPPGIYCDTLGNDVQLSKIAKFENEYESAGWTAEQIARFEVIERCGHKVIVVAKRDDDADDFTFWLSWSGDRWYLVAIERDEKCSA